VVEVTATTKRNAPVGAVRVSEIADALLGSRYELSVSFVGRRRAKAANIATRGKTYTPNVLSFPISKTEGEILICQDLLDRERRAFGLPSRAAAALFLIVHGCLHLKGMDHGPKMEAIEDRWIERLGS
jgi:probable rRNA maturation factor